MLNLLVDGGSVARATAMPVGGEQQQVPIQALVAAKADSHTVGLDVRASYDTRGEGDVDVGPVSVIHGAALKATAPHGAAGPSHCTV